MKVICRISGVPIWKSPLLLGMDLADEHPIFRAKKGLILSKDMIHRFHTAENVDEKKLIYLAVLNTTHLVEFQVPAFPSLATMEATFYQLEPLAEWVNFAEYKLAKVVAFPQYVVRNDNSQLENIRSWLLALEDIKGKVLRKELDRDKNSALLAKENEIKRELGDANLFNKAFTPKLAKWALEVCDITVRHADYSKWMKILCAPLHEVWIFNMADLFEIQEILQLNLPNLEGNPQAISVMHQMSKLILEHKKGFTEFSMFENDPAQSKDFEIIEDDLSDLDNPRKIVHKINQHLVNVPTEVPQLRDFPSKLAYLQAKAKWDLSKSIKDRSIGANDV